MLILLSKFEKAKKTTLLLIKFLILGFFSCFIIIIILTAYYQELIKVYYPGSLAPIYQELTLIEFFWMVFFLISFIFINTIIWYYISYDLIKKVVLTQKGDQKFNNGEIICFKCQTHIPSKNSTKNSSRLTPLKIFNIKGYFCEKCYKHFFMISLGTIILVPIIYFLYIPFTILFLYLLNFSFIPESLNYLIQISNLAFFFQPVIIFSIFILIIYAIYRISKISKLYDIKNQKFII